jgi:hypothetical protein
VIVLPLRRHVAAEVERGSGTVCLLVALSMHGACLLGLRGVSPPARARAPITTEVELAHPPAAPAPQPVAQPVVPPPALPAKPPPRAHTRAPAEPRPQPARAGALLTAPEEPEKEVPAADAVRFVSDPNGRGFGFGVVARGGTAEHGEARAVAAAPPALPTHEAITPADRLRRQPALLGRDGCRGFFPERAQRHHGSVTVIATVRASGAIARLEIEAEDPVGEGFAYAARACLSRQRFEPALDERGLPAAARTRIVLRFSR